jgi:Tol biopolymer transport system component
MTRPVAWPAVLTAGWLVLTMFALLRLLASVLRDIHLVRHAIPAQGGELLRRLGSVARRLKVQIQPAVALSDQVVSPMICCWGFRPTILIPEDSVQSDGDAWTAILCHELAHWKRRDHWAALLSQALLCCFPWHPLVWWAKRRLDHLSELACDRWVVACGESAAAYADSLLALVPQRRSAFALPVVGLRRQLETRIRALFLHTGQPADLGGRWSWTVFMATVSVTITVAFWQNRIEASPGSLQTARRGFENSRSGMELRLLVNGWASDFSSCPSADGRYVCDVDRDQNWELCVRDLVTGKSRLLTRQSEKAGGEPLAAAISPDNKYVVYNWYSDATEATDELRLVRLDGSGTRVLYTEANTNYVNPVQWSLDGKKILATINTKGTCQIVLISSADGSADIVKVLPAHECSPGLSPDGRYLAYDFPRRGDTNDCDLFLYDTRDRREIPLLTHPADDRFLGWSLDGKWILFSSDRLGTMDAWLVQVGEGRQLDAPRLIKRNVGSIKPKGFTRAGSFYYAREFTACDVYTASLDLETGRLLEAPVPLPFLGGKVLPAWSHDGRLLAYLKLRKETEITASSTLAIYSPATGDEREFDRAELGYFDWKCKGLRWSSDDRFILAEGYDKDAKGYVYQIDIRSGRTTVVADLSADGKTIVFSGIQHAEPEAVAMLREVQSARNKVIEIAPDAREIAVSPDGRSIAFIDWDEKAQAKRIMLIPAGAGMARELLPPQRGMTLYQIVWTSDGRDLLYVVSDTKYVTALWRVSAQGGPARRLWVTNPRLGRIAVHPDQRRIALGSSPTLQHEVWVLENFLPKE